MANKETARVTANLARKGRRKARTLVNPGPATTMGQTEELMATMAVNKAAHPRRSAHSLSPVALIRPAMVPAARQALLTS